MMNRLLIITTGHSDVQLAVGSVRYGLHTGRIGELHDAIRAAEGHWSLVTAPLERGKGTGELPDSGYDLCLPKVDAILDRLDREGGGSPFTHALVLETTTGSSTDPRYAGELVARRIGDQLGQGAIHRFAYLTDSEQLSNKDSLGERVVRDAVVERIETVIRGALEWSDFEAVVAAPTGGFPEVKKIVEEIVRLHAAARNIPVDVLVVPDSPPGAARPERAVRLGEQVPPDEQYRRRRQALELVQRGDFLGAYGLAQTVVGSSFEWVRVMSWLAKFISAQPLPDDCDIDVLHDRREAVKTAIRVELALLAGDIPRAVHGTVAFFESAWWDALAGNGVEEIETVNDKGKKVKKFHIPGSTGQFAQPRWIGFTVDQRLESLTLLPNPRPKLTVYGQQVVKDDVRSLRNDVAHGEPTVELMENARRTMVKAGLWLAEEATADGVAGFLTQSIVQNVLHELDVSDPEELCVNLMAEVRKRVVA